MDIQTVFTQLFGALLTVLGGLLLHRVKYQNTLSEQTNISLRRLEILFEIKIPAIESDVKDLKNTINIITLHNKNSRRESWKES